MFAQARQAGWVRRLSQLRLSENAVLLLLAVAVGVTTGLGVWLFREGIDFFQRTYREGLMEGPLSGLKAFAIVPVLALGGLIVGFLLDRFIGEERHHGVAGVMEASAFAGGRLRYKRIPMKALLSAFSLGAGASTGPEDPSVQIGANLGSMFGQWLHLSDDRVRLLVAAGAAGGISAAFRAPIAGVFFALEVVLGDFSTGAFGVVVLTAVISAALTQAIEAQSFIFSTASMPELGISNYALGSFQELPLYALLGIILAPVAALMIKLFYRTYDFWHHLPLSRPLRTAIAGTLVGLVAIVFPQVLGTSRDTINVLVNQPSIPFDIQLLILLAAAKIVATVLSVGGGFVGGMFAPALFVGAALGRAFGMISNAVFPTMGANPAAFAITGMAAAMTGVIRCPITAVLLLFELTNDYKLILPIMLATVVCLFVVERLAPQGLYHLGLARKGVKLASGRDVDLMQTITVREAMQPNPGIVAATTPASQLEAEFDRDNTHGLLVTDADGLMCGIVTLQDLLRATEAGKLDQVTVGDICTKHVVTITPDASISQALTLIGARDLGRLPVVDEQDPRKIVGLLRRRDIVRAYDLAIQRKQQTMQQFRNIRLATYSSANVIELAVDSGSQAAGHALRDVHWPNGSVVATVRRRGQVIVPHGDTMLEPDDMLTIVITGDNQIALQKKLQSLLQPVGVQTQTAHQPSH